MPMNALEPSNNELVTALREQALKHAGVTEVDAEEAAYILESLASRFVKDDSRKWWWQALKVPATVIAYGDQDEDALALLTTRIPGSLIYLIVSDDAFPPWTIFKGGKDAILEMIGEVWFFEYALANESLSWLAFDTHHNQLMICQNS